MIIDEPEDDLRIAAMPLSEQERAFRKLYNGLREVEIKLAEIFSNNPLSGVLTPRLTVDEEMTKRHNLQAILANLKETAARMI